MDFFCNLRTFFDNMERDVNALETSKERKKENNSNFESIIFFRNMDTKIQTSKEDACKLKDEMKESYIQAEDKLSQCQILCNLAEEKLRQMKIPVETKSTEEKVLKVIAEDKTVTNDKPICKADTDILKSPQYEDFGIDIGNFIKTYSTQSLEPIAGFQSIQLNSAIPSTIENIKKDFGEHNINMDTKNINLDISDFCSNFKKENTKLSSSSPPLPDIHPELLHRLNQLDNDLILRSKAKKQFMKDFMSSDTPVFSLEPRKTLGSNFSDELSLAGSSKVDEVYQGSKFRVEDCGKMPASSRLGNKGIRDGVKDEKRVKMGQGELFDAGRPENIGEILLVDYQPVLGGVRHKDIRVVKDYQPVLDGVKRKDIRAVADDREVVDHGMQAALKGAVNNEGLAEKTIAGGNGSYMLPEAGKDGLSKDQDNVFNKPVHQIASGRDSSLKSNGLSTDFPASKPARETLKKALNTTYDIGKDANSTSMRATYKMNALNSDVSRLSLNTTVVQSGGDVTIYDVGQENVSINVGGARTRFLKGISEEEYARFGGKLTGNCISLELINRVVRHINKKIAEKNEDKLGWLKSELNTNFGNQTTVLIEFFELCQRIHKMSTKNRDYYVIN